MGSRVAKNPIKVPTGVEVRLAGQKVTVKGKKGELHHMLPPDVELHQEANVIKVQIKNDGNHSAVAGATRAVVNNMVIGVNEGFERKLVLIGVGYRAKTQGKVLNLTIGYSHPVDLTMPEGITIETPTQTEILVKGADKQLVSQVAANIRAVRPVECYKGKGIRFENEVVVLKEGKKK